ncbi:MAG: glutamine-hydrolyzing GMP synthase [Streptomycetaceae bacterium]|nr:MAG: glutamine-hydrolyzing GMP synthase [Streptomycetaceae bacterium]
MLKNFSALRSLSIVHNPARHGVLVVDFGAQYAQLIARRVREVNVFSEIVPSSITAAEVTSKNPEAIILSGGPSSVYEVGAPTFDSAIFDLGIPVFGICYGFQVMAAALGGVVSQTGKSEFGRTPLKSENSSKVFHSLPTEQLVWMSHGDAVTQAPQGFTVCAATKDTAISAFENESGQLAGVQFHPEVLHSENGQEVLRHWIVDIAGCQPTWTTSNIAETEIAKVKQLVGNKRVICGLSGGVDSAVAAAIVQKAIGSQLTCVFVNHGLLREGEAEQVETDFVAATGVQLMVVDAREQFLQALSGVSDPETKRKIIGREFIRSFEAAAREIAAGGDVEFLVQGTLYPDVVESGGGTGTANIKSHHNVGGLPDDLKFTLIEPLRTLFKDEVRQVGLELQLPEEIVMRQPFPGPGLAIRIIGEITPDRLSILRHADRIAREELHTAGQDRLIWQCPVVLLADVRSVGVQGDGRTYGHPIVLRPVSSEDAMTADWSRLPYDLLEKISTRITNEVRDVNRVVLDITSKPPGTIEWE